MDPTSRRRWLALGLVGLVGLVGPVWAAPNKPKPRAAPAKPAPRGAVRQQAAPSAAPATPPKIVQREPALVPRLTAAAPEGPFYSGPGPVRPDISEGLPGVPLEVRFVVVDQTAMPFAGALVDLWHCDAKGVYSGFAAQGEQGDIDTRGRTFLRGRQATDRNGVAAFRTIYPGWYPGRTTHLHFKIWNGENTVLTSQLFMPDALSEYLYTQLDDYRRDRLRDTLNSNDSIALQAGNSLLGSVREEREQYVVTLAVAVDRSARLTPEPTPLGEAAPRPPVATGFGLDSAERRQALVPGRR
ncbi:intradiol ring-cleavage dioxygenase [Curvibacter sp. HBC61]|uniref:Intradiol ring-cleavage dioxygenase n=1 Tax=Curvibacter cyanobacteriorum TaxID=3026422 RepID=A0ABT5N368_9BURK|nr:intradiol ring-cleavage dioxygenase [Curvibacter sp. HBC61]MDD0840478.1 intradiol ring-cleavage dioxygenase [Curvibacter sp. HBC61]